MQFPIPMTQPQKGLAPTIKGMNGQTLFLVPTQNGGHMYVPAPMPHKGGKGGKMGQGAKGQW